MKHFIGRVDTDPVVQASKNVPFLLQTLDVKMPLSTVDDGHRLCAEALHRDYGSSLAKLINIICESILVFPQSSKCRMADSGTSAIIGIGIDIGTSQSSVALWNGYQVEFLKDSVNQSMIESCVTFLDDLPSRGLRRPRTLVDEMIAGNAIFNMKRLIGRMDSDPIVQASKNVPFLVQTLDIGIPPFVAALVNEKWRFHTTEEALATFLVELRMMAEEQLKRPLRNVAVTFPVSFGRFQLCRLERACAMAGIHVLRLMPEPAAVAMLYGQQQQKASHEKIAFIFNMGAGYTDVAVAATGAGMTRIIALAGSTIGGEDLLQNLMHHIFPESDRFLKSHGMKEIKAIALLRFEVQLAIRGLCSETSAPIIVDLHNGHKICTDIFRDEFEDVNRKVFEKWYH
ncbi:hypothetical protein L6164_012724 [Bauhinia variegata]|uniref:Uncharacterized protein n=1 Tax=Bauhinia variegata TaxID=167791 RepID=A0ACB9PAW4_BAUVA|nr:hypothetical protein L6164_012724 [Bauhinia variegata]